jgi:exodeoxyribonuclease VIII
MSMIKLANGLHRVVPHDAYHERERGIASKSVLDMIRRAPALYKAWLEGAEQDDTEALSMGVAGHCALLEPDVFATSYVVAPEFGDCRFKENKSRRDDWRAANGGRKVLTEAEARCVTGMVAAVRAHPLAGKMCSDGEAELTVRWTDPGTGLPCKARTDYYVRKLRMIVDVKTTADASREGFRKSVAKWRYHVQDAMYRAGFAAIGEPVEHFTFVVVEKAPPHLVAVYTLDAQGVSRGMLSAQEDLRTFAECLKNDDWPGYPETIQTLELPPWAA